MQKLDLVTAISLKIRY